MRVVVIGENTCLGAGLKVHLLRWGRHQIETIRTTKDRWKSERKFRKDLRKVSPDILVDLRFSNCLGDRVFQKNEDMENTEWIAKTCSKEEIHMLCVSNPMVFSGKKDKPYQESDPPDAAKERGLFFLSNEDKIREICEKHIILRLGPIFAAYGSNILTDLIGNLEEKKEVKRSNQKIECPLHASDGARVISGIIDQISASANQVGIYHYCGSEAVSGFDFSEAVLSSLLKFKFIKSDITLSPAEDNEALNFRLDCGKIHNSFGIRQMPWKQSLSEAVKNYYSER